MDEEFVWGPSQGVHGLAGSTRFYTLITAKDLGPYFLQDEHPDLISALILAWTSKSPILSVCIIREQVIDDHGASFTIYIDGHGVTPRVIDFFRQEYFLDALWVLGKR